MNRRKTAILLLLTFLCSFTLCGCWNYRDIEKYAIVSGFAIDKSEDGKRYFLTIELIDFETSGKEAKQVPKHVHSEGTTVFDAVRNIINETGRRLYWGHANLLIIGEDMAKEGIARILDFVLRDAEMREEMYVLVCADGSAKELFEHKMLISLSGADTFVNMIKNQKSLGKAPASQAYKIVDKLEEDGECIILPTIHEVESDGKEVAILVGTAVFKSDRLIGFLSPDETKYLLFAKNEFKTGLITLNEQPESNSANTMTLEVYTSHSKIKPIYSKNKLRMNVEIKTEVAIGEVETHIDYMSKKQLDKIERDAEQKVREYTTNVIKKIQNEYDTDILGFGKMLKADMPGVWRRSSRDWDEIFKSLEVNVKVDITLRNSALVSKAIKKKG
ncbi:MAG TPA: Ger(x)C family spore germination protein [Ruminiclostridium sp.]|nr:Ger(x)C family spore germination protein [Ruminiclostridium sp.]